MPKMAKYKATTIELKSGSIKVYASPKIDTALREILDDATLYRGVRFHEVLAAVYSQGKKDGARLAFETIETSLEGAKTRIPHRRPGKPRRKK